MLTSHYEIGCYYSLIKFFITLTAFSGKHNASLTVWPPCVCPSVCPRLFSNLNRARRAYSTWLTRWQHAIRSAYISVRV